MNVSRRLSCSIHGLALRLRCSVPALLDATERSLAPFIVDEWPEGFVPIDGCIQPYESSEVMQHLPETAKRYSSPNGAMELYADGHRFWLVDDRWGMTEIDLEAGNWKSWILPSPCVEPHETVELAMLWPAAQLLRRKGVYLLPAVSVAIDDWGMLLIGSSGLEPELSALVQNGYHIIGQRWTALREEDGGVAMLHVPGQMERGGMRRIRPAGASLLQPSSWVDLITEVPGAAKNHCFCHAVGLIEGSRRPEGWVRTVPPLNAVGALRQRWPMIELHPTVTPSLMPDTLASVAAVVEVRLSRDPMEFLDQIEALRETGSPLLAEAQALREAMPPANLTPWSLAG